MKKPGTIGILFLFAVFATGCGGRAANPVMVHQHGDRNLSCAAIERECCFIEEEISRLMPKTEKTGKNVALGVTGAFFIVPLFFMDFSHAEQIEVNAYRQRYNYLLILAEEKQCGIEKEQIPEFQKTDEEAEQEERDD
jgi:hypothetical protein